MPLFRKFGITQIISHGCCSLQRHLMYMYLHNITPESCSFFCCRNKQQQSRRTYLLWCTLTMTVCLLSRTKYKTYCICVVLCCVKHVLKLNEVLTGCIRMIAKHKYMLRLRKYSCIITQSQVQQFLYIIMLHVTNRLPAFVSYAYMHA